MENNKNHQISLQKRRLGFSSLDVVDRDEPKYQTRSPYYLTNAMISTDERYSDCSVLYSTVPAQSTDGYLIIIYGTEDSILQQPNSIGHCDSADARMSKCFADFISHRISGFRSTCLKAKPSWNKSTFCGIQQENVISTTLLLKKGLAISPTCRHCLKP